MFSRNIQRSIALGATAGLFSGFTLNSYAKESNVNWYKVKESIIKVLEDDKVVNPSVDDGVQGGGGYVGPMLVRLGWHSAGTWCKDAKNGGSNGGTMRHSPESDHGANAGLGHARSILEAVKKQHPSVSYADLYIYASVVAIEEMGGPNCGFRAGRSDAKKYAAPEADARFSPDGRLPDADKGSESSTAKHLRDIFYRMGFNDQEIVALSGAHALGRCHTDRSGYWGPWTRAESTFSNEYFRELVENKWTEKKTHKGQPWTGPAQFEDPTGELMMLPSDIVLIKDSSFNKWVQVYAKDEQAFFKDFAKAYKKLTELGCQL